MTERDLGMTGFNLILQLVVRKELQTGASAETKEKLCSLACSSWLAQCLFKIHSSTTYPGVPSLTMGWSHPTSITSQENTSEACPQADMMGSFSQLSISSQIALACVKVTEPYKDSFLKDPPSREAAGTTWSCRGHQETWAFQ